MSFIFSNPSFFKVKLPMTRESPKAPPLYPKTHLLAASAIAALLSLALLVFPTSEVEAKRTSLKLEPESPTEQLRHQDAPQIDQATLEDNVSPFAQIDNSTAAPTETAQTNAIPVQPEKKSPRHKEILVAKGDTLSSLFQKAGLPNAFVHELLASNKQAKPFTQLKHGKKMEFELGPDGQLNTLHSQNRDLESISLTKGSKGFEFARITSKPTVREAYAHGVIKNS